MDKSPAEAAEAKKSNLQEMSSDDEQKFIKMTEQEEDIIYRMHRLVGERWDLIAGRIPGRIAEEIERFWIMRHREQEPKC
ncbi:hypothetical protein SLE2022_087010 [Rubroshorea leprosula]